MEHILESVLRKSLVWIGWRKLLLGHVLVSAGCSWMLLNDFNSKTIFEKASSPDKYRPMKTMPTVVVVKLSGILFTLLFTRKSKKWYCWFELTGDWCTWCFSWYTWCNGLCTWCLWHRDPPKQMNSRKSSKLFRKFICFGGVTVPYGKPYKDRIKTFFLMTTPTVLMVCQGSFMVFGWFPWFFKVVSWYSVCFNGFWIRFTSFHGIGPSNLQRTFPKNWVLHIAQHVIWEWMTQAV